MALKHAAFLDVIDARVPRRGVALFLRVAGEKGALSRTPAN